jgi:hypothetical protein
MMKTPVLLVAAALTAAILLAASLVIATGTRGENGKAVFGEMRHATPDTVVARHSRPKDGVASARL